jgi:uncharacterized protein YidB (DUF937 family)
MGLFDELKSQLGGILAAEAAGAAGAQSPSHDPHAMLESVASLIAQHGGLGGLVEKLGSGGLADAVASWVGTGANQPVTGDALKSAVGTAAIAQIAERLGVPKEQATSLLAQYLPIVIDKLTPRGRVEEASQMN